MNYLQQLNAGFLLLTSQLFSGRVTAMLGFSSGLTEFYLAANQIINNYFYNHHQLARLDGMLLPSLRKYWFVRRNNFKQNYDEIFFSQHRTSNNCLRCNSPFH
jgi:hypothetical protein